MGPGTPVFNNPEDPVHYTYTKTPRGPHKIEIRRLLAFFTTENQ